VAKLISIIAFGFAWWLGLYLLARDATKPALLRAGIGLLGYALALATADLRECRDRRAAAVRGAPLDCGGASTVSYRRRDRHRFHAGDRPGRGGGRRRR
jgi:hypothetical protein